MSRMPRRMDMERQQWEEDLRLRQRNFVFPDTVRNEGNFYRRLLRSKTPLSGVQRFGLLLLAIPFLLVGCFGLAMSISQILAPADEGKFVQWLTLVVGSCVSLALCLFAALML